MNAASSMRYVMLYTDLLVGVAEVLVVVWLAGSGLTVGTEGSTPSWSILHCL